MDQRFEDSLRQLHPRTAGRRRVWSVTEREIAAWRGGRQIVLSLERLRPLAADLVAVEAGAAGSSGGWEGLSRRGRFENLLHSEHIHDGAEFLRRHVFAEQLYLAPRSEEAGGGAVVVCWDFDAAMLGSPRLHSVALVLALAERCHERAAACGISVNGEEVRSLETAAEASLLLDIPPLPRPQTPASWRAVLESAAAAGATLLGISCRRDSCFAAEVTRYQARRQEQWLAALAPRRAELWRIGALTSASGPWRSVEIPVAR